MVVIAMPVYYSISAYEASELQGNEYHHEPEHSSRRATTFLLMLVLALAALTFAIGLNRISV